MAPQRKNSNDPSLNEEEEEDVDESYYHDGKEDIKNLVHECEELSDMVVASVAKRLAVPESDAESAEPPKKKVKVEDNHAVKLKLVPVDQAVQLHSFVDASIKLQASSVSEPPMVHQIDVDMTSFISYHENTRKSDLEGYIEIPPNSDMTGVDETTTRICAALSGQIYTAKSKYDFDLSISGRVVEVILFDDNGILAETTPPIAIAITGNTMIIGWRGSQTLMDWIMDFAFAPMASRSWVHMAPSIRAQGGYCALVESYMCKHESTILKEVKTRGIQEILLTGHSLAGGLAQVAHCFLEGERLAVSSPWKCLDQVNIRCISFSAPMTTVNLNRKDKGSAKFLKKVGSNASNIIFESDP